MLYILDTYEFNNKNERIFNEFLNFERTFIVLFGSHVPENNNENIQ